MALKPGVTLPLSEPQAGDVPEGSRPPSEGIAAASVELSLPQPPPEILRGMVPQRISRDPVLEPATVVEVIDLEDPLAQEVGPTASTAAGSVAPQGGSIVPSTGAEASSSGTRHSVVGVEWIRDPGHPGSVPPGSPDGQAVADPQVVRGGET